MTCVTLVSARSTEFAPAMDCNLDTMKGLSRCYDPDSDAAVSVATGRATLTGKVDGEH